VRSEEEQRASMTCPTRQTRTTPRCERINPTCSKTSTSTEAVIVGPRGDIKLNSSPAGQALLNRSTRGAPVPLAPAQSM
jgi:hypothetical protein